MSIPVNREEIADRILRIIEAVDALDATQFGKFPKALDEIARLLNRLEEDVRPKPDLKQFEGM